MFGAIAGDIIGSVYEASPTKSTDFPLFTHYSRFTDDTVMTVAVASAILNNESYEDSLRAFGRAYPDAGYGGRFFSWLFDDSAGPYNSWGNGAAMRVSPVGFAFDTEEAVLREAQSSAEVSHNHPEGIKGAQATALAIFMARLGESKEAIRQRISTQFGYDLDRTLYAIRPTYRFDVSCQGSVPEAIIAFLESHDFEDAVRNAVSLGGDSDTQACIAGAIAQAFYRCIPEKIVTYVRGSLPETLLSVIDEFSRVFQIDISCDAAGTRQAKESFSSG